MLHGYCVRRAGDPGPPAELRGVDGAVVRRIEEGSLGIWVSEGGPGRPSIERLQQHERVVRLAMRSRTPLPLRFGSRLADDREAQSLLLDRAADFGEALDRIGQRVEMGVRVAWAEGVGPVAGEAGFDARDHAPAASGIAARAPAAHAGRTFLEGRKRELEREAERTRSAERILDAIAAELADLDLPTVRLVTAREDIVGSLAHLLHRASIVPYRKRVEMLQTTRPELRITASGPWAPYSFV